MLDLRLACTPTSSITTVIEERLRNIHQLYHPPVGRGLDNQLDVFGALRILYKTAFCRDMPWVFKPRFQYYTEDVCACASQSTWLRIDLSSQPYTEDDLKYYQEFWHIQDPLVGNTGQNDSVSIRLASALRGRENVEH